MSGERVVEHNLHKPDSAGKDVGGTENVLAVASDDSNHLQSQRCDVGAAGAGGTQVKEGVTD